MYGENKTMSFVKITRKDEADTCRYLYAMMETASAKKTLRLKIK
jgi:hypothetical protein